jgi:hypothetical protein
MTATGSAASADVGFRIGDAFSLAGFFSLDLPLFFVMATTGSS